MDYRSCATALECAITDSDTAERDQLCLLCVDYICTQEGVMIPWDKVSALMGRLVCKPKMTGEAIKQHLAKVYKFREQEGQVCPPKLERNQRRKANTSANDTNKTSTPVQRAMRGKRAVNEQDEDTMSPPAPVKPGASLIYKKPESKQKKSIKVWGGSRGGGRYPCSQTQQ
jgi:hypothetical protein